MKKIICFVTFCFLIVNYTPQGLYATSWEDEKRTWEDAASAQEYKDPGYAAKLSMGPMPIALGQFYVGSVGKGIWFTVSQTVCLGLLAIAVYDTASRANKEKEPLWTDTNIFCASAGGLGYMALKVWSAYDAAAGAREYNRRKQQEKKQDRNTWKIKLSPGNIQLCYSIPVN